MYTNHIVKYYNSIDEAELDAKERLKNNDLQKKLRQDVQYQSFIKQIKPQDKLCWFDYNYPMANHYGFGIVRDGKVAEWFIVLID